MKPQTRRFLASVVTTYVSLLFAVCFAVLGKVTSLQVGVGLGVVALLIALVAEYVLTYGPLMRFRDRQLSTFFEDYLRLVENDIEKLAADDVDVRANIMRLTKDGFFDEPTYKISFWNDTSDYSDGEFDLEFEIGQGCVGVAHRKDQQMFAISPDYAAGWDDVWDTTDIHYQVAGHLNTIIGTPIYRPDEYQEEGTKSSQRTDPPAVLIIDSEQEISDFIPLDDGETLANVEFKETDIGERATKYARNIGILL